MLSLARSFLSARFGGWLGFGAVGSLAAGSAAAGAVALGAVAIGSLAIKRARYMALLPYVGE